MGINVSKGTVSNALKERDLQSYRGRKTRLLTKRHVNARLEFANNFLFKNLQASGTTSFGLMQPKLSYLIIVTNVRFEERREKNKPKNTIPTVKFWRGNVIIWNCFSSRGTGMICVIKEGMNGATYQDIFEENLFESFKMLNLNADWVFQQHNEPKHSAKVTKRWFVQHNVNMLQWPRQSRDLNPIENL